MGQISFRVRHAGFSLLELLITVAVIAVLLAILLPSIHAARGVSRQVVCGTRLHSLGQAMQAYVSTYGDWLPGSPNTSGNGAYPCGWRQKLFDGRYYVWDGDKDAFPAIQIFDWAAPLLSMMNSAIPPDIPDRYDLSKRWAFLCPANNWAVKINHASRINIATLVPSYATSRFFTYVPVSRQTGISPGTLFWAHPFVPENYLPRMTSLENPAAKTFLADACRVDRGNPHEISNWDYGYTDYGAWLNEKDPETDDPSLAYRFTAAKTQAYRHRNGINLLFFDGHVAYQPEGDSDANSGFGSGSRQAKFWFPSGTDTRKLPNASGFSNEDIIVP